MKDLTWQAKKLLFQQMFFAFWIKEKEDPHGFHLQINHDRKKTSKKLLPFIQCTSMYKLPLIVFDYLFVGFEFVGLETITKLIIYHQDNSQMKLSAI